ncbi:MAG: ABC transporter ATP-binding protein [Oscillospiraceae bacterium]|nr:ABC transporter ATP-binding protein [Oscillospiraceae bacterium]
MKEDNHSDCPAIEFSHVSKSYEKTQVLRDISLTIRHGEFITIIGVSGCGKTTMLKMINALIAPDEGQIFVRGKDIAGTDQIALRRSIGYVIQSVGLFPHMTVRKNIEYVPHLYQKPPAGTRSIEELMEIVHLERELLGRYPCELSGGQKQRVGIARALAVSPGVMLMDEPFGSVDEITRKKLQESILEIHRQLHITIVFVTHDIGEALLLADRVLVLDRQSIAQFGTPDELTNRPATEFVRTLLGDGSRTGR